MMTRLCVPLTATSCKEMAAPVTAAGEARAEMIELRLDFLHGWDAGSVRGLAAKARAFDGEVIVTCRLAEEGGHWQADEAQRLRLLEAAASGADYLDVEYEAWKRSADVRERIGAICKGNGGTTGPRLVLSKHDFEKTPADLDAIIARIAAGPCDVAKLACKAQTITDSLRMLEALRNSSARRATIALTMGETGVLTRVLAGKFGALLTFASLATGKESAPGQLTLDDMRTLYRWYSLSPETAIYGVIGCPVAHSMSPAIHNAAFDKIVYDGIYLPMRVEADSASFKAFIDGFLSRPWLGLRGCSVTIPHKENLLRYVEQRGGQAEPLAKRIGVANTLCIEQGGGDVKVSAFNTDYRGALDALCDGMGIRADELGGKSVAVLGAGGVARAIVAGLRDCGCSVTIYNRTHAKAEALAAEFGATALPVGERVRHGADAVVNCTSIGMWPQTDATEGFAHHPAVFDTVYSPVETRLLREDREHGCPTIDGVSMFVNQAVAQFERWTGRRAPVDVMRDVVIARLCK